MNAILLVHPEWGVLLGTNPYTGTLCWSLANDPGMPAACTFEHADAAEQHMARWDIGRPQGIRLIQVIPDLEAEGRMYASAAACMLAGAPPWINGSTDVVGGVQ